MVHPYAATTAVASAGRRLAEASGDMLGDLLEAAPAFRRLLQVSLLTQKN